MAKEIFCAFGVDVDAVAGWLGSYGGEDSPCDITRGLFAGEIGSPRLLQLFDRAGIQTTWFIPGHSIETFPKQMQMVADADAYIRSGAHRPVHGRTARAAFYDGWTTRIGERLAEARAIARAGVESSGDPASRDVPAASTSTALALAAKEVEVGDYLGYMKRQHGVAGTWRGSSAVCDEHST